MSDDAQKVPIIKVDQTAFVSVRFVLVMAITLFILAGFVMGVFYATKPEIKEKAYDEGFINGTQYGAVYQQVSLNNKMVDELSKHGSYVDSVVYNNETFPIECRVVQRQ